MLTYLLAVIALVDVYWVLRLAWSRLICYWLPRVSLTGEGATMISICWTTDLDIFLHMNNGKYFKEMDFGRFDFYFRSGLTEYIQARPSWYVVQHAASIKYRRPLNFLVPFKLVTRLRYWDERSLYFEQKFVSLHDGFVRAIATSKNTVVGGNVLTMMSDLGCPDIPSCPPDIRLWLESQEVTSASLRPAGEDSINCGEKED